MTAQEQEILKTYAQEAKSISTKILLYKKRINQISFSRLIVFFAGIILIYALGSISFSYVITIVISMITVFFRLIQKQSKLQKELVFDENLLSILNRFCIRISCLYR